VRAEKQKNYFYKEYKEYKERKIMKNFVIRVRWTQLITVVMLIQLTLFLTAAIASENSIKLQLKKDVNPAPLGVNLSSFNYWNSAIPFKDLMMQTRTVGVTKSSSNEACPTQPPLNKEGYPTYLPNGCIFKIWSVLHIKGTYWPEETLPYQAGRYVLLYRGSGKIVLGWDAKNAKTIGNGRIEFDVDMPQNGIQIKVTETDQDDPITDLHIVHSDDEATYQTQPFNEKWLSFLDPFQVIRFSNWGNVSKSKFIYASEAISHTPNSIQLPPSAPDEDDFFQNMVAKIHVNGEWPRVMINKYDGSTRTLHLSTPIKISTNGTQPTVNILDFVNKNWSERAKPISFGQDEFKGIAFEYMIKLANTLNIDPWISIPTAADNDFVEELALLIKNTLKPSLKCYIEYSNETWNYGYPGFQYSEAKGNELGLTGALRSADSWHAYRAIEIFRIFNQVYDEPNLREVGQQSRLVRILTSQTSYLSRARQVMDWQMPEKKWPTNGFPAYKYADAWAITAYYGQSVKTHQIENASPDELIELQIDLINTLFGNKKNPGLIRDVIEESNKRNLKLVVYEGGTHMLAPRGNQALEEKLAKINENYQMKDVYLQLIEGWNQLYQEFGKDKIGVLNHYNDISKYGKSGYWGLMQSIYQDTETAPKYQAILEYASQP